MMSTYFDAKEMEIGDTGMANFATEETDNVVDSFRDFTADVPPDGEAESEGCGLDLQSTDDHTYNQAPLSYELQQGLRILKELMSDANKSVNWHFLHPVDSNHPETADYYAKIKKPIWLGKMKEKFDTREYETITQFVTDFRQMLENCYRFNGPDHFVSRRAQKLETMMEQKLNLLSRDLREKTSISATSGQQLDDTFPVIPGMRRRSKAVVPHDSTALLNQLRVEEQQKERDARKQQMIERKAVLESHIQGMMEWEDKLIGDQRDQLKAMWELPSIGLLLFLCHYPLNIGEVLQFEIERCLFMPRESSTLQRLMTTLLSTPFQRQKLDKIGMMPYRVWNERLRDRMAPWFKLLKDSQDPYKVADKFGLDPFLFQVVGKKNPLKKKKFHELSLYKKVWLLKCLVDNCVESQESLVKTIESQYPEEQKEYKLGEDEDGNTYMHFPQFCGADVRVYRRAYIPEPEYSVPEVEEEEPPKSAKKRKSHVRVIPLQKKDKRRDRSKSKEKTPVPKKKPKVQKTFTSEIPTPPLNRPSRLRQTIKTVLPVTADNDSSTDEDEYESTAEDETQSESESEEKEGMTDSGTDNNTPFKNILRNQVMDFSETSSVDSDFLYIRQTRSGRIRYSGAIRMFNDFSLGNENSCDIDSTLSDNSNPGQHNFSKVGGTSQTDFKNVNLNSLSDVESNTCHKNVDERGDNSSSSTKDSKSCLTEKDTNDSQSNDPELSVEDKSKHMILAQEIINEDSSTSNDFSDGQTSPLDGNISDNSSQNKSDIMTISRIFEDKSDSKMLENDSDTNSSFHVKFGSFISEQCAKLDSPKPSDFKREECSIQDRKNDENVKPKGETTQHMELCEDQDTDVEFDEEMETSNINKCDNESEVDLQDEKMKNEHHDEDGKLTSDLSRSSDILLSDVDTLVVKCEPVDIEEKDEVTRISDDVRFQYGMKEEVIENISNVKQEMEDFKDQIDDQSGDNDMKENLVNISECQEAIISESELTEEVIEESVAIEEITEECELKEESISLTNVKKESEYEWAEGIKQKSEVELGNKLKEESELIGDVKNECKLTGDVKEESGLTDEVKEDSQMKEEIQEGSETTEVKRESEDIKTETDLSEVKTECETTEEMKEESDDEEDDTELVTGPDIGSFELVADCVEEIRMLVEKFAEQESYTVGRGKKARLVKPPPRKKCVVQLHNRLEYLLKELEPWEQKLIQASKKARLKMKKEYEDYDEKFDIGWESDHSESTNSATEDNGVEQYPTSKLRMPSIPKDSFLNEDSRTSEECGEWDISLRGRIRKRRIIPNNVEDQGLSKKRKTETTLPITQPTNISGKNVQSPGMVSLVTSSADQASGQNPGHLLLHTSGGQTYYTGINQQGLNSLRMLSHTKQTAHPIIQQLLRQPGMASPRPLASTTAANTSTNKATKKATTVPNKPTTTAVKGGQQPGKVQYFAANINSLPPAVIQQLIKSNALSIQAGNNQQGMILLTAVNPSESGSNQGAKATLTLQNPVPVKPSTSTQQTTVSTNQTTVSTSVTSTPVSSPNSAKLTGTLISKDKLAGSMLSGIQIQKNTIKSVPQTTVALSKGPVQQPVVTMAAVSKSTSNVTSTAQQSVMSNVQTLNNVQQQKQMKPNIPVSVPKATLPKIVMPHNASALPSQNQGLRMQSLAGLNLVNNNGGYVLSGGQNNQGVALQLNPTVNIGGQRTVNIAGQSTINIGSQGTVNVGQSSPNLGSQGTVNVGQSTLNLGNQGTLNVGQSSLNLGSQGTATVGQSTLNMTSQGNVNIGGQNTVNLGGQATLNVGVQGSLSSGGQSLTIQQIQALALQGINLQALQGSNLIVQPNVGLRIQSPGNVQGAQMIGSSVLASAQTSTNSPNILSIGLPAQVVQQKVNSSTSDAALKGILNTVSCSMSGLCPPISPVISSSVTNLAQGIETGCVLQGSDSSLLGLPVSPGRQQCKYASNVTVKTLLEARKPSFTETLPENHGTIVVQATPTGVKKLKLPSKAALDSAIKTVVTEVKTSLPTANIKVPSPVTMPSIQPRRNITKTIQSMKVPIPTTPKVEAKSTGPITVQVSPPFSSVPPSSSAIGQPNVALASPLPTGILNFGQLNNNGQLMLSNIKSNTNVPTGQNIVQGYLTPQGLIIPSANLKNLQTMQKVGTNNTGGNIASSVEPASPLIIHQNNIQPVISSVSDSNTTKPAIQSSRDLRHLQNVQDLRNIAAINANLVQQLGSQQFTQKPLGINQAGNLVYLSPSANVQPGTQILLSAAQPLTASPLPVDTTSKSATASITSNNCNSTAKPIISLPLGSLKMEPAKNTIISLPLTPSLTASASSYVTSKIQDQPSIKFVTKNQPQMVNTFASNATLLSHLNSPVLTTCRSTVDINKTTSNNGNSQLVSPSDSASQQNKLTLAKSLNVQDSVKQPLLQKPLIANLHTKQAPIILNQQGSSSEMMKQLAAAQVLGASIQQGSKVQNSNLNLQGGNKLVMQLPGQAGHLQTNALPVSVNNPLLAIPSATQTNYTTSIQDQQKSIQGNSLSNKVMIQVPGQSQTMLLISPQKQFLLGSPGLQKSNVNNLSHGVTQQLQTTQQIGMPNSAITPKTQSVTPSNTGSMKTEKPMCFQTSISQSENIFKFPSVKGGNASAIVQQGIGLAQPNTVQQGIGLAQPNTVQQGIGLAQPNTVQQGIGLAQPNTVQQGIGLAQPNTVQQGIGLAQHNTVQQGIGLAPPNILTKASSSVIVPSTVNSNISSVNAVSAVNSSMSSLQPAVSPTQAKPNTNQGTPQKLFLYNINGQLVTAQGVPVTVDNGVLKILPQPKVQMSNFTLPKSPPASSKPYGNVPISPKPGQATVNTQQAYLNVLTNTNSSGVQSQSLKQPMKALTLQSPITGQTASSARNVVSPRSVPSVGLQPTKSVARNLNTNLNLVANGNNSANNNTKQTVNNSVNNGGNTKPSHKFVVMPETGGQTQIVFPQPKVHSNHPSKMLMNHVQSHVKHSSSVNETIRDPSLNSTVIRDPSLNSTVIRQSYVQSSPITINPSKMNATSQNHLNVSSSYPNHHNNVNGQNSVNVNSMTVQKPNVKSSGDAEEAALNLLSLANQRL